MVETLEEKDFPSSIVQKRSEADFKGHYARSHPGGATSAFRKRETGRPRKKSHDGKDFFQILRRLCYTIDRELGWRLVSNTPSPGAPTFQDVKCGSIWTCHE
jgi:hypothetical protein